MIFELQQAHGNSWRYISKRLSGGWSNVQVKGFFYSALRKCVRLVNMYISSHRHLLAYKHMKLFEEKCVCKIISQEQGNTSKLKLMIGDMRT